MDEVEIGWLACRDCKVAHPLGQATAGLASEFRDEPSTALAAFLDAHTGHKVTHLHRGDGGQVQVSRPLWDPMATIRIEVTDGRQPYVLTAMRNSIDEPRGYQVTPGRLPVDPAALQVDAQDVRRSLAQAFYPDELRPAKIDSFVSTLTELVSRLEPGTVEPSFDDARDPAVSMAALPESVCSALVARCADIFDPTELARVLAFLHDNRAEDGALAVRIRRDLHASGGSPP